MKIVLRVKIGLLALPIQAIHVNSAKSVALIPYPLANPFLSDAVTLQEVVQCFDKVRQVFSVIIPILVGRIQFL